LIPQADDEEEEKGKNMHEEREARPGREEVDGGRAMDEWGFQEEGESGYRGGQ